MDETTQQLITNIILPLIVTGAFNLFLFRMQSREREPVQKVEIADGLEELARNLTNQLREAQKLIQELRTGIAILLRQFRQMEVEPEWRPNGHDIEK